jgi:hypothetical protein
MLLRLREMTTSRPASRTISPATSSATSTACAARTSKNSACSRDRVTSRPRASRSSSSAAGGFSPGLAQVARTLTPAGIIPAGRLPGEHGYQGRVMGTGQDLRVAQRPKAPRRAARPDNHTTYPGHRTDPSSPPAAGARRAMPDATTPARAAQAQRTPAADDAAEQRPLASAGTRTATGGAGIKTAARRIVPAGTAADSLCSSRSLQDGRMSCRPGFPAHLVFTLGPAGTAAKKLRPYRVRRSCRDRQRRAAPAR